MKVALFIDNDRESAKEQFDFWQLFEGREANVHSVDTREVGGKMVISMLYEGE